MAETAKQVPVSRESFASKFGFMSAIFGTVTGVGSLIMIPFTAIRFGGGAFILAFVVGTFIVAIPTHIVDAVFGMWGRRTVPFTYEKITGGKRIASYWAWFQVVGEFTFMGTYSVIIGMFLDYMFFGWTGFFGPSPGSYFWGEYTVTFRPMIWALIVWAILWLVSYKSVNQWAKLLLWQRPLLFVMLIAWLAIALSTNANYWQAWALTFDFKPETLLDPWLWSVALMWVYWRNVLGLGISTTFASYLPRGGDITNSIFLGIVSDNFAIFLWSLTFPVFMMGIGIPPLVFGSLGLSFAGAPSFFQTLGTSGALLMIMFYFMMGIVLALPANVAANEYCAAALMDRFGFSRVRGITLSVVVGAALSVVYALPLYDAVNYMGTGLVILFTEWFWEAYTMGIGVVVVFVLLFKYFGTKRAIDLANESSTLKLPASFKYVFYLAFFVSVAALSFILVQTTGIIPGVPSHTAGGLLTDGTAYYGFAGTGLVIIGFILLPRFLAPIFLSRKK